MRDDDTLETCKHGTCLCAPIAGGSYCSAYCEEAAEQGHVRRCECGHESCGAEPLVDHPGMVPQTA